MKALPLVVVLVLALALGAAAWLFHGGDEPPPAGGQPGQPTNAVPQRPSGDADAERSDVPAVPPPPTVAPAAPTNPAEPPAKPAPASERLLRVVDGTTDAPVPTFRWRLRVTGQPSAQGDGTAGTAALPWPGEATADLLVEAPGYTPAERTGLTPPAADQPLLVPMVRAATAAGIHLRVTDAAQTPFAQVRVDAFPLRPATRDLAWHLASPRWSRRTATTDGRLTLPELEPGEYGIRLYAVDDQGGLLPFQPFVRSYALTGGNSFVEDAVLEPGTVLELELVDRRGNPLDPAHGAVTLGLRRPGGPVEPRLWLQVRDGKRFAGEDTLPGAGPVTAAEPLVPGAWQLDVLVDRQPGQQIQLLLRAGEHQRERIVVP